MGATLAVIGVVVAEMIYPKGLGQIFQSALTEYRSDVVFAGLVTLSIAAFIWSELVSYVGNWIQVRYFRT
jgi:ABC-type nitrate/sulfonate/bicarbonate transport system permease component